MKKTFEIKLTKSSSYYFSSEVENMVDFACEIANHELASFGIMRIAGAIGTHSPQNTISVFEINDETGKMKRGGEKFKLILSGGKYIAKTS